MRTKLILLFALAYPLAVRARATVTCADLTAARNAPMQCQMDIMRAAAEPYNKGVSQEEWSRNTDQCIADNAKYLTSAYKTFFLAHRRQILKVLPGFDIVHSSNAEWDVLLQNDSVCSSKSRNYNAKN